MNILSRRSFAAGVGTLALSGAVTSAIEIPQRINPKIRGLSLAAYSLRTELRWMKGKDTGVEMEILDVLNYAAEQGFDGVELTAYFFDPEVTTADLNEIKRRAHVLGLDITGGAIGNNFSFPVDDPFTAEQIAYTKTWIDHYSTLGAPVIRIFAGGKNPPGATAEQVIENVVKNLNAILPYAAEKGVILGIENHDSMTNMDNLLELIGRIDSRWLGVTWDSANVAPTEDPYAELARIAPYAVNAQLKVMTKVNGEKAEADLGQLIQILRDADYSGHIVLEYEEKEDPFTGIPKFKAAVESALGE
jgi:sugar phosphate isomerase/epimerase